MAQVPHKGIRYRLIDLNDCILWHFKMFAEQSQMQQCVCVCSVEDLQDKGSRQKCRISRSPQVKQCRSYQAGVNS